MFKPFDRSATRVRRHQRLRKKVMGTAARPRLSVYRSLKHFHIQLIDDVAGSTLLGVSSLDPEVKGKAKRMASAEGAKIMGSLVASRAKAKNIEAVVFDRGGMLYHGAVKALAESAREAGLKF
jgi:large subunit ribosomal protein L18